jgi:Zn finger protein HypA/HybF involved in hydrogenase expression
MHEIGIATSLFEHVCFEALVIGPDSAPALDIEFLPRQNRCPTCGTVFALKDYQIECPKCGAAAPSR